MHNTRPGRAKKRRTTDDLEWSNNKALLKLSASDIKLLSQDIRAGSVPTSASAQRERHFRFDLVHASHDFEYASKPGHFTLDFAEPGLLIQQLLTDSAALAKR